MLLKNLVFKYVLMNQAGDGGSGGGAGAGNKSGDAGAGQSGSGSNSGGNGGANGNASGANAGAGDGGGSNDPLFGAGGDSNSGSGGRGEGQGAGAGSNNSGQQGQGGAAKPILPNNWKDALPDDLKGDAALGVINDIPGLAKSYINAQKMIGADKVAIPGKHATTEDWKEVYHKLGNPRSLEEYKIELDPEAAKGMDTEFVDKFKSKAHEFGVLPRQAKALADWFGKLNQEVWQAADNAHNQSIKEGLDSLKKDWGQDYDASMVRAKAAAQEFLSPEEQKWVKESGLSQNANFLKMLEKVGKTLAEDKVRKHTGANNLPGSYSPSAAQAKIDEIMRSPKHPYFDPNHEGHLKAKKEVEDLYLQAHPKKSS